MDSLYGKDFVSVGAGLKERIAGVQASGLPGVKAELGQAANRQSDEDRLFRVVRALCSRGNVGGIHESLSYIHGIGRFRLGTFVDPASGQGTGMAFFGAKEGGLVVGLAGSARHMLESAGDSSARSLSHTATIFQALKDSVDLEQRAEDAAAAGRGGKLTEEDVLIAREEAVDTMEGPARGRFHRRGARPGRRLSRPCPPGGRTSPDPDRRAADLAP